MVSTRASRGKAPAVPKAEGGVAKRPIGGCAVPTGGAGPTSRTPGAGRSPPRRRLGPEEGGQR
jgi:hypothetical protein